MTRRPLTRAMGYALKRTLFGTVLAAVLSSAWGIDQNSSPLSRKVLSPTVEKSSSSPAVPHTDLRQHIDDPDEPPRGPQPRPSNPVHGAPSGIRYIVEAPFISQVPLRIVVSASAYAELCLYNDVPQNQLCVTIDSPLPAGMDLEYTDATLLDPDDDARFLSFVPVSGNSDPEGWAASRFIDALGKAAATWGNYLPTHPQLVTANSENCYAELEAPGFCENKPDDPLPDPNIPIVEVPGHRDPPYEPPPYTPPTPEPPPYEMPPGGGGGGGSGELPPVGKDPKDKLLAQLTPVAKPCGRLGPGGLLCSVTVFGKRPPPLPATAPEPVDRGRQYFAPQVLCNLHILCNEGQEPRDNDRGTNSGTSGKTQAELDQICVDINIREINVCYAIIKAKGRKGADFHREVGMCTEEANNRMSACFATAKKLTDNGEHPAP